MNAKQTIAAKLHYLVSSRGADAATKTLAADASQMIAAGDLPMARYYLRRTVAAWEASTGYTFARGELAMVAA